MNIPIEYYTSNGTTRKIQVSPLMTNQQLYQKFSKELKIPYDQVQITVLSYVYRELPTPTIPNPENQTVKSSSV